jgi:hypothetical protein
MPLRACAAKLRTATTPQEEGRALAELLRNPPEMLQQGLASTPVADMAMVLYRASQFAGPDGQRVSSDVFSALGPANVVGLLDPKHKSATQVLQAAAASSPKVCADVVTAAQSLQYRKFTVLAYMAQHGDEAARRAVQDVIRNAGGANPSAQAAPAREAAAAATPVELDPIRACHERLGQGPDADAQHIRLMLQQINGLSSDQSYRAMRASDPDMVADILSAASQVKPTPDAPENAQPLVGEVILALSTEALQGCLASHTRRTVDAAAISMDVPSLGRLFDAANRAGAPVCALVCEEVRQHGNVPIEQVLQRGTARDIAELLTMASLADPPIGANVLWRAADHGSDPLGRLRESSDPMLQPAVDWVAARSGTTVEHIDRRRELLRTMRTRETSPVPPSQPWREVGSRPESAAGPARHFTVVGHQPPAAPGAPGRSREPGPS